MILALETRKYVWLAGWLLHMTEGGGGVQWYDWSGFRDILGVGRGA